MIRPCRDDERAAILAIVNAAAEAYRGVIPADRWHEPYMPAKELDAEIAAGVVFQGCFGEGGELVGVMGVQPVGDVDLIRHAYVAPAAQGRGIGRALIEHLMEEAERRVLVGTWAAAEWAIRFYERNGFERVPPERVAPLLRTYWNIPERQIETSVVLEYPAGMADEEQAHRKPSEQEAREKGEWAETAEEGIVPAELGGSEAPEEKLPEDPELDSSVVGRTTGSDEPATEEGVDLEAGDRADATTDGGNEPPAEGEPDMKDIGSGPRQSDADSAQ